MTIKYVLEPDGNVKKEYFQEINRLPNKGNREGNENNKFSDVALDALSGNGVFTRVLLNNSEAAEPEKYVVNSTKKLRNDSFGFEGDENKNREITYYNSYNTAFDLELDNFGSESDIQIFANNLDFYGFPHVIINPLGFVRESLWKLLTLIDSVIAATVPIITISTLQFILQTSRDNIAFDLTMLFGSSKKQNSNVMGEVRKYELGKYITYISSINNVTELLTVLVTTLNSFERLMNFPRFPDIKYDKSEGVLQTILNFTKAFFLNLFDRVFYFIVGYLFYLIPGFKNTPNLQNVNANSLLELLQSLITSDQSKHIFNLLLRKIVRNNYFYRKMLDGARKTTGLSFFDLNESLSYLGKYFYRFIGERVAVGEKLVRTDIVSSQNKFERFNVSRFPKYFGKDNGKYIQFGGKLLHNYRTIIPENANEYNTYFEYYDKILENRKKLGKEVFRLSKKDVDEIEKIIQKDYVPFSLHDLRNNDIFRFHAFIESISDSFSSNFNEAGGYGRIEKIKTYINTTRTLNVSFRLIAMSKEDHDEMWYTINKIISMIYPQWSRSIPARQSNIDEAGIKYHLPFTQLPSNTPVVRLRIGDLIKSNYSEKNLAALFGFIPKAIEPIKEPKQETNLKVNTDTIKNKVIEIIKKHNTEIFDKNGWSADVINNKDKDNQNYTITNSFNIKIIESDDEGIQGMKVEFLNSKDEVQFTIFQYIKTGTKENALTVRNKRNFKSSKDKIKEDIKEYLASEFDKLNAKVNEEYNKKVEEMTKIKNQLKGFMASEDNGSINNLFSKAYETTGGKGLAGNITSLGIDWDQNTPWDTSEGNRAPMMVTITLGFSPIHDIPLGLDHNGMMRAVPYMVGNIVNNKYDGDAHFVYEEKEFEYLDSNSNGENNKK